MSDQQKEYQSKVLLEWETDENAKKIVFPKKNCVCRKCHFSDWQIQEVESPPDEEQEPPAEPTTLLELINYCHDRYRETFGRGLPNVIACDGFYKQPKE